MGLKINLEVDLAAEEDLAPSGCILFATLC